MTLGETIKQYRAEKGMSQGDLADALDVSRQSVSKWENDLAVPELDKLVKLSEIFGVTLDELVKGKPPAQESPASEAAVQDIPAMEKIPDLHAPETRKTVSQGQRITGTILLCTGAVVLLLLTVLGGFVSGLIFSCPFVLCGLICLFCPNRAGLWCAWAVYISVDNYLHYATGTSRAMVFQPYYYTFVELNPAFIISWVMFLLFVGLIILTLVSFRKVKLPVTKKNMILLCCLAGGIPVVTGIGYGVGLIMHHQVTTYSYQSRELLVGFLSWAGFLLDWVRSGLFTSALAMGLAMLRGKKKTIDLAKMGER